MAMGQLLRPRGGNLHPVMPIHATTTYHRSTWAARQQLRLQGTAPRIKKVCNKGLSMVSKADAVHGHAAQAFTPWSTLVLRACYGNQNSMLGALLG